MSDRAKSWFARWKMGQNLKNSYLPHRGELRPHISGGEPWPTYLQNNPKLERFRDFGTPNLGTPTTITSVKIISTNTQPFVYQITAAAPIREQRRRFIKMLSIFSERGWYVYLWAQLYVRLNNWPLTAAWVHAHNNKWMPESTPDKGNE